MSASTSAERLSAPAAPAGGELLAGVTRVNPIRNPYRTYLDNLRSPESRRTMKGYLDRLARIMQCAPLAPRCRVRTSRGTSSSTSPPPASALASWSRAGQPPTSTSTSSRCAAS